MGSINSAFSLISGALEAEQSALSIVSGNVANANTPGYTRQQPIFVENSPVFINGLSYGTGVSETGATSVRDRVLQERLDQQQQLASASSTRLAALNTLQALFTPASGSASSTAGDIGSDITSFFASFSSLEANPTSNALRQHVLSTATVLAGDLSNAAAAAGSQRASLDQETTGAVSQINALTSAIAQLNAQIQSTSAGADAGPLEDQRQQDLSRLSQLIGINQVTTENNGLTITTTSGQTLISEGAATPITTGMLNGVTHLFVGGADVTAELAAGGGQLGGYLTARDQDIPNVLGSLDQLAFGISTLANTQNGAGLDLNGNPGSPIFAPPAQVAGSAASMSVLMADPNGIAAAGLGQGTGDNSNTVALAGLSGGLSALLNGQTPSNFYSGFVTTLGAAVLQAQTENTAQNASVTQLQTQSNALSAVNLNDEASALTTLERSYQAASQVFAILNTIMASSLNLGVQTSVS